MRHLGPPPQVTDILHVTDIMMAFTLKAGALPTASALLSGCPTAPHSCPAILFAAVTIVVRDAQTNAPITAGTTVVATVAAAVDQGGPPSPVSAAQIIYPSAGAADSGAIRINGTAGTV